MSEGSGGEKTEQPTSKRLRDAREKGQVPKSTDLVVALTLLCSAGVLWFTHDYIGGWLSLFLTQQLEKVGTLPADDFSNEVIFGAFFNVFLISLIVLIPLFGTLVLVSFGINYLQVGSLFTVKPLTPDFNKLNPVQAFQQKFFKSKTYLELVKTFTKLTLAMIIVSLELWSSRADFVNFFNKPLDYSFNIFAWIAFSMTAKIAVIFIIIGGLDYFLQIFLHKEGLKMTKQEVKQEYKETEGDPLIKSRRRQIHRQLSSQNVASAVKKASVVIANPTHLAVALRYEQNQKQTPIVVAKGADLMAAQIRLLAEQSNVPIKRDVMLARTLYKLEVDQEIPEELYEAVAVVLMWVYQKNTTQP